MSRRRLSQSTSYHRTRVAGAAIAAVMAVAALMPAGALAQPGEVQIDEIDDEWQLLEYRDAGGQIVAVPPGISVTFQPFNNLVSGRVACGQYDAAFKSTDRTITIEPADITEQPCDDVAQSVDDAFFSALDASTSLSVEGDILKSYNEVKDHLLTLTRARIPLDPNIARWELARIGNPDGSIKTITGLAPTMEFLHGGGDGDRLSGPVVGSTGCGAFLGYYQTDSSTMRITDVDTGPATCTEAIRQQADTFVASLGDITDFDVKPAGLTLVDDDGIARLSLSPIIDLGNRTWTPTEALDSDGTPLDLRVELSTSAVQFLGNKAQGITFCGKSFDGRSIAAGLALSASVDATGKRCRKGGKNQVPPQDVEDAFTSALNRTASHALRGEELELLDRDGNPLMRLLPQAELRGPTWVLTSIDTKPGKRGGEIQDIQETTPTPITAEFSAFLAGATGASGPKGDNSYDASYRTPGGARIEISNLKVTNVACRGNKAKKPMCVRERQVMDLLQRATGYVVRVGDLRLLQDGAYSLRFEKEQPNATDQ